MSLEIIECYDSIWGTRHYRLSGNAEISINGERNIITYTEHDGAEREFERKTLREFSLFPGKKALARMFPEDVLALVEEKLAESE